MWIAPHQPRSYLFVPVSFQSSYDLYVQSNNLRRRQERNNASRVFEIIEFALPLPVCLFMDSRAIPKRICFSRQMELEQIRMVVLTALYEKSIYFTRRLADRRSCVD